MGGFAWVTLATTDSYSLGALVLAHSLKHVGTRHQLAVLITPGVTDPMRNKLREVFDLVEEVNVLDSKDEANLNLLKRPELGVTFTKLHCWRLTQYEKCVFLDADTLVIENCDELFERDELSAAPDVGWPDCFNSGVFVYCPSNQTFSNLVQFALDKGSFDGGDQGLLNLYFSDWAHKDIRKHLPFIYNMSSTACYSYLPAFKQFGKNAKIVHFIGGTKPWLQYFDIETRTVHPSHELQHMEEVLQHWWNIFCNSVHPSLSNEMSNPSTSTGYDSFLQNVTHTSYYYLHESQSTNVADDYEYVWDPWEEYLEKLEHNRSPSPPVHHESSQYDSSDHAHPNQDQYHSNEDQYDSNHDQNHPYHNYSQEIHISDTYNHEHSDTSQLIESHNTNTEFAHHYHEKHFSPPTYSQSQPSSPTVHYDLPSAPVHEPPMTEPPPCLPTNESDQCVATMIVSNETSLHSNHEDEQNDDSGFAGAFAKLTLGVARTPEQAALDDHLRRQGWEVGNIDYLGRDSFDNIWSKICETLAAAPTEPAPKPKEPSPPKPATTEPSDKIEKKTEQTPQPEQPKQEVPTTVEAPKAAEVAAVGPVCATQASKPTEAQVTDPVCALPLDTQTATPPKQEASEILACPISTTKSEAPSGAESATVRPLATATPLAEKPICPASVNIELSATILTEPVSVAPSLAEGSVCPIPPQSPAAVSPSVEGPTCPTPAVVPEIPVSTALPTAGPVSPIISSMPEPPLAICPAPPPTTEPATQSPAPTSSPQCPAAAPVLQTPGPVTVPQSPTSALLPQSSEHAPTPQSPAPSSVPQSPTPAAVSQSPIPAPPPQNPAPASVPLSPAPASVPQSPVPASVPQSPTAAVPESSAPIPASQTPASASVPPAPVAVPQSPTPAVVPQSHVPTSMPQSVTPASDSLIPAPDALPQSPQPAPTPQSPAPATASQTSVPDLTPQSPAPASTPQTPAPASTPQSPAPASTPQSPAIASTPQSAAPTAETPVEVTSEEALKSEKSSKTTSQTEAPKEASKDCPTEVPTAAAKPTEASQKPQEKQAKAAEQASIDTAGPTPPPRKGSGPKKSGGKGKK